MEIAKLQSSSCFFRKQVCLSSVERERESANLSNTFSRYFCIVQMASSVSGLRLFISGNPVVFLCGQIKHFKRCSCIQIKCGPLLHTCHNIDTGPVVSILVSSNRRIEHSTSEHY